jgi:hypothetical protein
LHGSVSIFDPSVVLLKLVVQVHVGPMQNLSAQFTLDGCGIAIMAISGDAVWHNSGHRSRRTEERFGGRKVPMPAQHYIDQRTIAIGGAIKVAPLAMDFDVCSVDMPARPDAMAPTPAELFS